VLGSVMLYDAPGGVFRVSWAVILPTVGATVGIVALGVAVGVRALYRRPTTGPEGMIGTTGVVKADLAPEGQVMVEGELWRAIAEDAPVPAGERIEVRAVEGLTLRVARAGRPV